MYKLKRSLKSEHKIVFGKNTEKSYRSDGYCSFNINNKKFANDLISKGVVHNKTYILEPPCPSFLPEDLVRHFIRGYFDGDGSIYATKSTNEGFVSFVGRECVLIWIMNHIKQYVPTKASIFKYKHKNIYEVKIGGSKNLLALYYFLYDNASVFLDRKNKKYKLILNID